MTDAPAFVRNGRLDILYANRLATALYAPAFAGPGRPVNLARFVFLDPRATELYADWDDAAHTMVALLRTEASRAPGHRDLSSLVGELSARSDEFRARWAGHDMRLQHTGIQHFRHAVIGDLVLAFEVTELQADTGLTLTAYSAEPGSPAHDGLKLLSIWAATLDQAETTHAADGA